MGSDVYHLTGPPSNQDPKGWMALQYIAENRRKSVVMAYRLADSPVEQVLRLRALDPGASYKIAVDGKPAGSTSAQEIAGPGLPVRLDAEWRAAVIELEAEP